MKPTKSKSDIKMILCIILICFMGFVLLHDINSTSLLGSSPYNSYELQAHAWLKGQTHLDFNYPHLELAVYKGHYYVSFPPFPSVVMLPFVLLCGDFVPNNLIIAIITIATVILAYKILRRYNTNELTAAIFAIFYVFGSNMMSMSLNGGVWFMAQALNLLLCTLALNFYLRNRLMWAYIMLGFAVGCRPFSAVYIVALFIGTFIRKRNFSFSKKIKSCVLPALPLIAIAAAYMLYNYARFSNPLEFGHNYLPEFTSSEFGQFNIRYLGENLRKLFHEPIRVDSKLNLSFTKFNGFLFYIANPIFLIAAYKSVRSIFRTRRISVTRLILLLSMAANLVFICLHKTLGGWQFGARYTCDMMAAAFLCIITTIEKKPLPTNPHVTLDDTALITTEQPIEEATAYEVQEAIPPLVLKKTDILIIIFGIMFNIYGAIEMWLDLIN